MEKPKSGGSLLRRTKIVCTIGPASSEVDPLRQLMRAGMDVVRLNFSHGDAETHLQYLENVREASRLEGKPVAVMADLQGPKLRIGQIDENGIRVQTGDEVILTALNDSAPAGKTVPVGESIFPQMVKPGDRVLIDDGTIELQVMEVNGDDVVCKVVVGGLIQSRKGINLPGVRSGIPAVTAKDEEDLGRAISWGVDWVALSFVGSARDVEHLRDIMRQHTDTPLPIIAKVERPEAIHNIDEIIQAADGIMVARGDMGIEIPAEQVPMVQKRIIKRCNEAGVPVVTATQMLDSMIRNPTPTRAETSDVANAILDGTDAVMLSGETAVGLYPLGTVRIMARIICEVEKQQLAAPPRAFRPARGEINHAIAQAIASSARDAAEHLSVAAIIAITASGYTARIVSRYRPRAPILAISPDERVIRKLLLHWGVTPLPAPRTANTDEMIENALSIVRQNGLIQRGDLVILIAGSAGSSPGTTNFMQIRVVN